MTTASTESALNPSRDLVSWSGEKTARRRACGEEDAVDAEDETVPLELPLELPFVDGTDSPLDPATDPFSLIHPFVPF